MRRLFFLFSIVCLAALSACDIESSGNGDLDGYWRLEQVDSLNGRQGVAYADKQIFWSFQHDLIELSNLHDNSIIYRLKEENRVLFLEQPCMFDRADGDTPITDLEVLRPYGVNALQEQFRIVSLESEVLVLESSVLRLSFRKY